MGQKVTPLIFHIKKNTIYNNIWNNNINKKNLKYKNNIKLYYNLNSILKKNNIYNLPIIDLKYKINRNYVEILIIIPKLNLEKQLITYKLLFNYINYNNIKLNLFPYFTLVNLKCPYMYPKYIIMYIKKQINLKLNLRKLLKEVSYLILTNNKKFTNILGLKIQVSGKLNPNLQAYKENLSIGQLTLHTKKNFFFYEEDFIKLTRGIIGIKLWINYI